MDAELVLFVTYDSKPVDTHICGRFLATPCLQDEDYNPRTVVLDECTVITDSVDVASWLLFGTISTYQTCMWLVTLLRSDISAVTSVP